MRAIPGKAEKSAAPGEDRSNLVVLVLAFAGISVAMTQTTVIPLVPMLPGLLHASAADTAWAVTATLLAGAVATPVVGRLGDMYGKRRMLLISLAMLIVGSVVCGLSGSADGAGSVTSRSDRTAPCSRSSTSAGIESARRGTG